MLLWFAYILFRISRSVFVKDICNFLVVSLPGFGISVKVFKIHSGFKKKKRERDSMAYCIYQSTLTMHTLNGNLQEYEHFMGICTGKLFGRYCFCPTPLFCRDRIKIQWVKWFTQSKISYSEPRLRILLLDFQLALILLNYGLQFAYT